MDETLIGTRVFMHVWKCDTSLPHPPYSPNSKSAVYARSKGKRRFLPVALVLLLLIWVPAVHAAAIELANDGQTLLDVVTSPDAEPRTIATANDLAAMLNRMTGSTFKVKTGDGTSGIAVGTAKDFPSLNYVPRFGALTLNADQSYFIRSHANGLHLIGASAEAVDFSVWDFLHRIGYRSYFPGQLWEIVPDAPKLSIPSIDEYEAPDYTGRAFWPGYGLWKESSEQKDLEQWFVRNRMNNARFTKIKFGHIYGKILRDCREAFESHHEYLARVDGKREFRDETQTQKFCTSNPGLQQLVVDWSLAQFKNHPDQTCLSLEPSDGGDWCECANCLAMGTPSDRALHLANIVSQAINSSEVAQPRYVTLYAYNEHCPPPNIRAAEHVVVGVATAFIPKGYSVDQVIDGWADKGVTIAIREYYYFTAWSMNMPADGFLGGRRFVRSRGGDIGYLAQTIPHFYRKGARFSFAEAGVNWIANGLGYYFVSRALWDVDQAAAADDIIEQFVSHCFNGAEQPMVAYFKLLFTHGHDWLLYRRKPLALDDTFLSEFNRLLADAWERDVDPIVRQRIGHCILYSKYVDLLKMYLEASGETRQENFERLIKFTYRTTDLQIVSSLALYRDVPRRDRTITIPEGCDWTVPEADNPWKDSSPFSLAEMHEIARELKEKYVSQPLVQRDK